MREYKIKYQYPTCLFTKKMAKIKSMDIYCLTFDIIISCHTYFHNWLSSTIESTWQKKINEYIEYD